MNKEEFLSKLRIKLSGLPKQEVEDHLLFYSEIIDDKVEDGMSLGEAIIDIGSVDEIKEQIIKDISLRKIIKERIKPKKRLNTWTIVLLSLGSPIWLSLVIAFVAVIFSLYASLWAITISMYSIFISLATVGLLGPISGVLAIVNNDLSSGLFILSMSLICIGIAIFAYYGCKITTKLMWKFTKKISLGIKKIFIKKENKYE